MPTWRSVRPTRRRASASAVDLTDLLSRRLLFVTGKGGTGKTVVSAALARVAAQRGLRTLVCEMDGSNTLSTALGSRPLDYEPIPVAENLWAMVMRTDRSLQEYLKIHLRIPVVPEIRQLSSVFDFVADAAPGVKEVLAVGKVCWEVKEDHYDVVIVDAEASGHVVAQISSPRTIHSLVPRGPLRDQTSWMLRILDDPARCGAVIVSTPEELPVTESLELASRLRAETGTEIAAFVVNMSEPEVPAAAVALAGDEWFASVAPAHAESVRLATAVRESQVQAGGPLRSAGAPVIVVPAVAGDEATIVDGLVPLFAGMHL